MNNPATYYYPSASSLFVGDLHPVVTEVMLHERLSLVGPVLSVRVCRDVNTRLSRGYGYVNFQNPADVERALNTMNFAWLGGQPMRLMRSQRDPNIRRSGVGNVYMKNLDKSLDEKALYDSMSVFGKILSCKVARDDLKQSKGYGFVHFESEEAAQKAIAWMNGMVFKDKKLYVGHFIPRRDRILTGTNNVYIKNFPDDLNNKKLRELFAKYGKIISAKVLCNEEDGKSRRFGFVCFEEPEAALKAAESINGTEIGGRVIYCGLAQKAEERRAWNKERFEKSKTDRFKGANLYVKNIDYSIDEEWLRRYNRYRLYVAVAQRKEDRKALMENHEIQYRQKHQQLLMQQLQLLQQQQQQQQHHHQEKQQQQHHHHHHQHYHQQ